MLTSATASTGTAPIERLRIAPGLGRKTQAARIMNEGKFLSTHLREGMMIIVPAFTDRADGDSPVFHRVDILIVRLIAPHVRSRIHQPGDIQRYTIPAE